MSTEEAKETEEDILVMLSKGVAYACAEGTEPLVKRLYQQVGGGGRGGLYLQGGGVGVGSFASLSASVLLYFRWCCTSPRQQWSRSPSTCPPHPYRRTAVLQALLYIPEAAVKQPPIHVLVVDYSSIYGTDCAAVDTIVMQVWEYVWGRGGVA